MHTNGNLGADSIAPIRVQALDSVYVAVLQNKIAEMEGDGGQPGRDERRHHAAA